MKTSSLRPTLAAAATVVLFIALAFASGTVALAAFALLSAACFTLIVAHDYAPRRARLDAKGSERLPYAA